MQQFSGSIAETQVLVYLVTRRSAQLI